MSRKNQIAGLLKRYQFVDFATVVAKPRHQRKNFIRAYLDRDRRGRWSSYQGFRALVPDIVGVRRGLDGTEPMSRSDIPTYLRRMRGCHPDDFDRNVEAAEVLFDLIRPREYTAYNDHRIRSLLISRDRSISMQVEHYVVEGERGIFRWVYPRRERLEGRVPQIALSLIHHNYVQGDFAGFDVEMVDLSCEPMLGPRGGVRRSDDRRPHILGLPKDQILPREELSEDANHIYSLLMEIADEEDRGATTTDY